jgi:hypothetical protein
VGGIAAAVGGATYALYSGVKASIELQDVLSANDAVFGSSSKIISAWADDMAAKFGAVKTETNAAAASFGQIFKAAGKTPEEAATIGTSLAKLGMDLASFKGGATTNADAFQAIQGALQGNFQGNLDRFNVFLTMAEVNERAVTMGLARNTREVDENAKKMAIYNLIMEKTKDQQGDLERTSDQSANSWRRLSGTFQNLAADIGTAMMPAISALLNLGADAATGLSAYFESNKETFVGWGQTVVGWADEARMIFRNLGDIWEMVTVQASAGFLNFLNVLAVIPENVVNIGKYIADNWYQLIYDGVSASITVFQNFAENLRRIVDAVWEYMRNPAGGFKVDFKPLLEGFAATSAALPELVRPQMVDASEQLAKIQDRIAAREADRLAASGAVAKAAADVNKPMQQAAQQAAARREKDFKSQTFDSDDFYTKLREQALSGKDDTAAKQLAEQKRTADAAEKTAALLGGGALVARLA